ncbi:MAG TPA: GNAT family N-acetyltransferase [Polyangia bacterium]|nr:GNAT family N-acetyltransferase [Polyangia bacterium]
MTSDALRTEIARSVEVLESLEAEWWALADAAPTATPFQTPGWLLPWWRHLGGGELVAVLVRDARRLRGLAPLTIEQVGGARRLRWMGAGVSDYLTALVDPELSRDVWELLLGGLTALLDLVGGAVLDNVPEDDPLFAVLEQLPRRWAWRRVADASCLAAPLPRLEPPSSRPRICQKAAASSRRLARVGPVRLSDVGGPAGEPVPSGPLMEVLFELHGQRWRARGEEGVTALEAVRAHHREAATRMQARGLLRLHALEHAGKTAGVLYGFQFRARRWMYLCGFAPALSRFSPGSILVDRARASALAEGALAMDFLRGREPYKLRWGTFERRTWRIDITRAE